MKRLALLPLLLAACGPDKPRLATATIDTLPNGAVSVMSPGPTAWSDTSGWKLVEVQELGTGEGDSIGFNQPGVTALDGEGRLYVTDEKPALIRVFDRQGRPVRTIGQEGGGPGEFRAAFIAIHGSNLVVHDPQQSRTSVFDTSGTFIRSWASQCCFWSSIAVDRQGRAYIPGMSPRDSGQRYYRYPMDGSTVDTLQVWPGPEPKMWTFRTRNMVLAATVPFTPEQVVRVNPGGGFFVGMTNRYQIIESSNGRDTTRIFGRVWASPPLSDHRRQAAVDSAIKSLGKMMEGADVKKTVSPGRSPHQCARLDRHRGGRPRRPVGNRGSGGRLDPHLVRCLRLDRGVPRPGGGAAGHRELPDELERGPVVGLPGGSGGESDDRAVRDQAGRGGVLMACWWLAQATATANHGGTEDAEGRRGAALWEYLPMNGLPCYNCNRNRNCENTKTPSHRGAQRNTFGGYGRHVPRGH